MNVDDDGGPDGRGRLGLKLGCRELQPIVTSDWGSCSAKIVTIPRDSSYTSNMDEGKKRRVVIQQSNCVWIV